MPRLPDLFEPEDQTELFALYETRPCRPDPDDVRARLYRILAEARAAERLPWGDDDLRHFRTVFPQMANWLPEEEGLQLCFEFEAEVGRLKAA